MKQLIVYVHGKGGSATEAEHYKALFPNCGVYGFDYKAENPWEAKTEFLQEFERLYKQHGKMILIANSIGAFFSMHAGIGDTVSKAYLISPIVNMEKLISDMMNWANVSEAELSEKKEIKTEFGETLSWEYLTYVRKNPLVWNVPTKILYGEKDNLTSLETMKSFADKINAPVTVMPDGEHWFHTEEQMKFLDEWICVRGN